MLKHLDKNVRVAWVNQRPLWRYLKPKNSIKCSSRCVCADRNLCFRKNIVYKIKCNHCPQFYVGETHRTLFSRVNEHLKLSNSNVFCHLRFNHFISVPCSSDISALVIRSGFVDATHRRKFEEENIIKFQPEINKQYVG